MSDELHNPQAFISSWSAELGARLNRVRHLIGRKHWPTDGHYKEQLLIELFRRYLPSRFVCGTGFLVSPFVTDLVSREIDILVVDTWNEPPLLNEFGTLISYAAAGAAQIQVKTTFSPATSRDALSALNSAPVGPGSATWNGAIFLTAPDPTSSVQSKAEALAAIAASTLSNEQMTSVTVTIADDHHFVLTKTNEAEQPQIRCRAYETRAVSFGLFLCDLLEHLYVRIAPARGTSRLHHTLASLNSKLVADVRLPFSA